MTVRRIVTVVLALVLVPVVGGTPSAAAEDQFDRPHVPNRLVVRFRTADTHERSDVHRSVGTRLRQRLVGRDVVVARSSDDLRDVAARYLRDGRVASVEPDYTVEPYAIPNDSRFGSQWGLHNTGQTGGTSDADIDAPEAWDVATSTPVRIAIMDTGYETSHSDLAPNHVTTLAQGGCPIGLSNCNHGTLIAGIAAARGNNGIGVAGTAWDAGLLNVPFDFTSTGVVEALDDLIDYSKKNNVRISITGSFGARGSCPEIVSAALDRARAQGLLFSTAAGNDTRNNDQLPDWPSSCPQDNVIAVTSTDDRDRLASFSNIGPNSVDIAAPGTDIETTRAGNSYTQSSGTSISVPFVAAAAALVWGREPSLSYSGVRSRLFSTVDKLPSLNGQIATGGRLNLARALGAATDAPQPTPTPPPPGNGTGSISGTTFGAGSGGFICLFNPSASGCGSQPLPGVRVTAVGKTATSGSGGRYTLADVDAGTVTVRATTTTQSAGLFGPPSGQTVSCSADSSGGPTSKTVTVPDGGNVQVDWYCPSGGGGFGGFLGLFGLFFRTLPAELAP